MKKILCLLTICTTFILTSSFAASDFSAFPYLCKDQRADIINHVSKYKNDLINELYHEYLHSGIDNNEAMNRAKVEYDAIKNGLRIMDNLIKTEGRDPELTAIIRQKEKDRRRERE